MLRFEQKTNAQGEHAGSPKVEITPDHQPESDASGTGRNAGGIFAGALKKEQVEESETKIQNRSHDAPLRMEARIGGEPLLPFAEQQRKRNAQRPDYGTNGEDSGIEEEENRAGGGLPFFLHKLANEKEPYGAHGNTTPDAKEKHDRGGTGTEDG